MALLMDGRVFVRSSSAMTLTVSAPPNVATGELSTGKGLGEAKLLIPAKLEIDG
jgi:hypothetical protein